MEVKEAKEKLRGGINKTAILVALILGLSIAGYGYMNISYKNRVFEAEQVEKTRERLAKEAEKDKQEREEEYNRTMLNACLEATDVLNNENWKSECEAKGLKEDCLLPSYNADRLDTLREKQKEECFKKYPVE